MPYSDKSIGKKLGDIAIIMIAGLVFYLGLNAMGWVYQNYFETVSVPDTNIPPLNIATDSGVYVIKVFSGSYIPSTTPFGEQYNSAPRILVGGKFQSAKITVIGKVIDSGNHYLLFNFNTDAGVINAVRKTNGSLDIIQTKHLGGLYTEGNSIDTTIDLMGARLGTSNSDFSKYGTGSKLFSFIASNQKPEVYKVLVIPFHEDGSYGGAQISSMIVEYKCQTVDGCVIKNCLYPKSSQCIQEKFGTGAMLDWRLRNHL